METVTHLQDAQSQRQGNLKKVSKSKGTWDYCIDGTGVP